jgi:hypothetical protein
VSGTTHLDDESFADLCRGETSHVGEVDIVGAALGRDLGCRIGESDSLGAQLRQSRGEGNRDIRSLLEVGHVTGTSHLDVPFGSGRQLIEPLIDGRPWVSTFHLSGLRNGTAEVGTVHV